MNLLLVAFFGCICVLPTGQALKCYNCTYMQYVSIIPGCSPGNPMDDKFLTECKPGENYCSKHKLTVKLKTNGGVTVDTYTLNCASLETTGCKNYPTNDTRSEYRYGCFESCQTDGCNAFGSGATTTTAQSSTAEVTTQSSTAQPTTQSSTTELVTKPSTAEITTQSSTTKSMKPTGSSTSSKIDVTTTTPVSTSHAERLRIESVFIRLVFPTVLTVLSCKFLSN